MGKIKRELIVSRMGDNCAGAVHTVGSLLGGGLRCWQWCWNGSAVEGRD